MLKLNLMSRITCSKKTCSGYIYWSDALKSNCCMLCQKKYTEAEIETLEKEKKK